jgi:hypothetical protein
MLSSKGCSGRKRSAEIRELLIPSVVQEPKPVLVLGFELLPVQFSKQVKPRLPQPVAEYELVLHPWVEKFLALFEEQGGRGLVRKPV